MSDEKKNIVIVGGSFAGLSAAHYFLKHALPSLPNLHEYHVYVIDQSTHFFFRVGAPRAVTSAKLMPLSKLFFSIEDALKQYDADTYNFVHGKAVALDTGARTVSVELANSTESKTQTIPYYALILATGTRTASPLFSQYGNKDKVEKVVEAMHDRLANVKSIIIAGGGPTGVETAGELGEYLNGRAGCFSSKLEDPKVEITLLSGSNRLLSVLRQSISQKAENYLAHVGVKVVHRRMISIMETADSTTVTLDDGETMTADMYIPAVGVIPNTDWIPTSLLNEKGYINADTKTLRVEEAGPRVYVVGDAGAHTRGGVIDIYGSVPVAVGNLRHDLLAAENEDGHDYAAGEVRSFTANTSETQCVPIGQSKGVGAVYGWRLPSFLVWFLKGRDYMINMSAVPLWNGNRWSKGESTWKQPLGEAEKKTA